MKLSSIRTIAQECRNKALIWQREIEDLKILTTRMKADNVVEFTNLIAKAKLIVDVFASVAEELEWTIKRIETFEENHRNVSEEIDRTSSLICPNCSVKIL